MFDTLKAKLPILEKLPFREKIREMRSIVPWTKKAKHLRKYDIGKRTYGFPIVADWGSSTLKIGKYCSIAEGVTIFLGGEHRTNWVTSYPITELLLPRKGLPPTCFTKGNVVIGDDVWIGSKAFILSGVTIGSGAVIGAGTMVTKSVPPYGIVCGNPGKLVRLRIEERFIPSMLEIAWWDWPEEKILAAAPLLLSENIAEFIATYGPKMP